MRSAYLPDGQTRLCIQYGLSVAMGASFIWKELVERIDLTCAPRHSSSDSLDTDGLPRSEVRHGVGAFEVLAEIYLKDSRPFPRSTLTEPDAKIGINEGTTRQRSRQWRA